MSAPAEAGAGGGSAGRAEEFRKRRERQNECVHRLGTQVTKRFFNLDGQAYKAGAIDEKHKELMGLVASAVLRCDDCISYHVLRGVEVGASREQIVEALDIALIVGGSIVIPHLRRAYELLDEVCGPGASDQGDTTP